MKRLVLISALLASVFMFSCKKNDSTVNSNNNSNNSQQELYDWFIDNGWHDAIVSHQNSCSGSGHFYMYMDASGNIEGSNGYYDFRLYSSFEKVKSLTTAPTDGYTSKFTCESKRYGIQRSKYSSYNGSVLYEVYSYCKFYVERINSSQVKVYYKEWYSVEDPH